MCVFLGLGLRGTRDTRKFPHPNSNVLLAGITGTELPAPGVPPVSSLLGQHEKLSSPWPCVSTAPLRHSGVLAAVFSSSIQSTTFFLVAVMVLTLSQLKSGHSPRASMLKLWCPCWLLSWCAGFWYQFWVTLSFATWLCIHNPVMLSFLLPSQPLCWCSRAGGGRGSYRWGWEVEGAAPV